MPNPFPGMDPYLEGDLWTSVHTDLCVQIAHQLAPKLRPKYVVRSTRRVVLALTDEGEESNGSRVPDIGVSVTGKAGPAPTNTAMLTSPLVLRTAFPEPIPHVSVEIHDVTQRRLVTCIEVLSPTNKRGSGREEYEAKRLQICSGPAHLVEIDLLRVGARFPTTKPLPEVPYFVFVSRAESEGRSKVEVWPMLLEQPLSSVAIPLLPPDPDVTLDLQAALSTEYDIMGYDESLDYSLPPTGPLTEQQAAWIDERLRSAGRRR